MCTDLDHSFAIVPFCIFLAIDLIGEQLGDPFADPPHSNKVGVRRVCAVGPSYDPHTIAVIEAHHARELTSFAVAVSGENWEIV